MSFDPFLAWVESTALSQWVTGSPSLLAFPAILTLHAIGMGFAVGISAVVDLRVLGVAAGVPIDELRRFLPILWLGFWVNVASGVLLVIGYPTKALTNPVFYLKLAFIAVAMLLLARIKRLAFAGVDSHTSTQKATATSLRRLAIVSLVCWTGAITAGRLLAYTYTRLHVLP
jgi:hypothetical protein